MKLSGELYQSSLSLLTDLYQLTMAYGYWKNGMAEREAAFDMFFRHHPFEGGYTVAAGLEYLVDYIQNFRFTDDDIDYLATLKGNNNTPLFERDFLNYLKNLSFSCDIDAVPEGTVVFPNEPLVRVKGPILQCQLLETPLLNLINFPTLIATKAARVSLAADGDPVLDFGLRRAQGIDGGITMSRACYIGGVDATSNVLAGKLFDIPVKGTHAHSWVMAHEDELTAFRNYVTAMPHNAILLVDTYDSIEGVKNAVKVGQEMQEKGLKLAGIRLDSGDLGQLSIQARKILDDAGFTETKIVASSDLDEYAITDMKNQGACIDIWGVGTRLATAYDDPALGGVYKISAMHDEDGKWNYKLKLSEEFEKITDPGLLQVRRFYNDQGYMADMIYNTLEQLSGSSTLISIHNENNSLEIPAGTAYKELLEPVFREGKCIYGLPSLKQIREKARADLSNLSNAVKKVRNPEEYFTGLEYNLYRIKKHLITNLENHH